jgi:hypothetical protein
MGFAMNKDALESCSQRRKLGALYFGKQRGFLGWGGDKRVNASMGSTRFFCGESSGPQRLHCCKAKADQEGKDRETCYEYTGQPVPQ